MYSIGLFQIRLSIFFYFLLSSGTNRRRTYFLCIIVVQIIKEPIFLGDIPVFFLIFYDFL